MIKIKHTALLLVLFLSIQDFRAEPPPKSRYKRTGNGTRLNFGTGLNFYSINENHGSNPKQKPSFTFGFRREVLVSRDYKAYILFGMDYALHGLTYQSYYFQPDSIHFYNKKFDYTYALSLNEIQIPFQFKYLLRRADNSPFSPYFLVGYHLRYMLPGILKVSQDGLVVKNDLPEMKFRNYLVSDKINASVSASLGWQRNNLSDKKGSFFIELNFQYGFSQYYFQTNYSAASMFINGTMVTLFLGTKF
ncbi:MAG: hypothetical protein PSX36_06125 [bacterium]|nr:hypothetical protein [bacterium]